MTKEEEALKLASEFDKRFTSMNSVDVPERVNVPRDEWRVLHAAIKQCLAAPVQKPAFHGFIDEENCCVHMCFTPHAPGGRNNELATAYYTTPPATQRRWVGLTEADRELLFATTPHMALNDVAWHAIEAKLKEKNT